MSHPLHEQFDCATQRATRPRMDANNTPCLNCRAQAGERTAIAMPGSNMRMAAISNTAGRLALLAGETPIVPSTDIVDASRIEALPKYFEVVGEQVEEIAQKRQEIVEKRLSIFQPTYPEAELQVEAKPALLIGIGKSELRWFAASVDSETANIDLMDVPAQVQELLAGQHYDQAIEFGFNIITYEPLEQIDTQTQLLDAIEKYYEKYYPDDTPE